MGYPGVAHKGIAKKPGRPGLAIEVYDKDMHLMAVYPTIHQAAKGLDMPVYSVKKYALSKDPHPVAGVFIAYRNASAARAASQTASKTRMAKESVRAEVRAEADRAAAAVLMMHGPQRPSWMR